MDPLATGEGLSILYFMALVGLWNKYPYKRQKYQRDVLEGGRDMEKKLNGWDGKSIDRSTLKDIGSVRIDPNLPKHERIKSFVSQIGNPYCYLDGDVVVRISYADTDVTLEDRLKSYACGLG